MSSKIVFSFVLLASTFHLFKTEYFEFRCRIVDNVLKIKLNATKSLNGERQKVEKLIRNIDILKIKLQEIDSERKAVEEEWNNFESQILDRMQEVHPDRGCPQMKADQRVQRENIARLRQESRSNLEFKRLMERMEMYGKTSPTFLFYVETANDIWTTLRKFLT